MVTKLKNMSTHKNIQNIDFGILLNYKLNKSNIFCTISKNTSLITKELVFITKTLDDVGIKYTVDKDFNIKVAYKNI